MGERWTHEDVAEYRDRTLTRGLSDQRARPVRQKVAGTGRVPRRTPGQMNNLERSYAETVLAPRKLAGEVLEWWFEAITFKLADDCRYTPDFLVMLADRSLECHETKAEWSNGQVARDDALVKLKVAALQFPFRFYLCFKRTKKNGGDWKIKEVGP